jgi:hypothetical protein
MRTNLTRTHFSPDVLPTNAFSDVLSGENQHVPLAGKAPDLCKRVLLVNKRAATPSFGIRVVDLDSLAAQHLQNVVWSARVLRAPHFQSSFFIETWKQL